ncbi:PREDICTED: adhesion G-protein coupled receptor F1-like [Poecilia mexicana]|uniref:adhesion G-protein coupled receptor F1-like n=1 Tax=Poecilia mexicana TaxID=48701 RepID=UPI00072DDF16|nr:PREDICTED: adhesion G-protein coupled receptor F1-like [Poecilia mexicana]
MPQNTTMTPPTPVPSTVLPTTTSATITTIPTTILITNHTTTVPTTHQATTTPSLPMSATNMTTAITKTQSTSAQPTTTVIFDTNTTLNLTNIITTKAPTPATSVTVTTVASSTVSTTTVTLPPSPTPTATDIKRSMRLEKDFIQDYNNKSSSKYKELEEQFNGLLSQQYNIKNGVIAAFVTDIRQGSVIVDFTIRTFKYDNTLMAEANDKLIKDIENKIAPVLDGKVQVQSDTPLTLSPEVIYTDETMTLTCAPPGFTLENSFSVEWKFKGLVLSPSRRHTISSKYPFTLVIAQVIPSDAGTYECTSTRNDIIVHQNRTVLPSNIRSAPIISVSRTVLAKCDQGKSVPLKCCVQSPFKLKWYEGNTPLQSGSTLNCITYQYPMQSCTQEQKATFTCKVDNPPGYEEKTVLTVFLSPIICKDAEYGEGRENDIKEGNCEEGQTGTKTAVCLASGTWKLVKDTCIITIIKDLLTESVDLKNEEVPEFTGNLTKAVNEKQQQVTQSPATISAIVNILNTIAQVSNDVEEDVMQDVLETVDVLISDNAKESWSFLNTGENQNSSSLLLFSMETISERLNGSFTITTQRIQLKRTKFTDSFNDELNSTVTIEIPETGFDNTFITTILFSSLNNVMPPRTSAFNLSLFNETSNETYPENVINAAVLLVKINEAVHNVSLSYNKLNTTLELNPQCVFWNFTLLDNLGAWDDKGCKFVSDINDTVTCTCNHLTSFSILMSTGIPEKLRTLLDIMTYIGVGISMVSLVICLIIEGIVWRPLTKNSTAFMRHVAIVNTALSLLIADICFIIGAAISKNPKENPDEDYTVPVGPCSAATFFMHFFYLAMFFWMLVSSLLLLYRSVMVFSQMSKWTMFAIGLTVGYVCPLIIAVTTVAATAPGRGYVREDQACWLNWTKTKALLALVIPALAIVVFNILVILVVLYKMLRRRSTGNQAQADEKNALLVILRCVAILSPLFGLTWCLGIGTMVDPTNGGIHVAFAFFNSLQGFFILVFGTLFDAKIRSLVLRQVPALSTTSNRTRSTSAGTSSSGAENVINRIFRRRGVYRVSPVPNTSSNTDSSQSYSNI